MVLILSILGFYIILSVLGYVLHIAWDLLNGEQDEL